MPQQKKSGVFHWGSAGIFLLWHEVKSELVAAENVSKSITIDECKQFHPEQWVNLYGVFAHRCDYLITCQVYQIETVISKNQRHWWDDYFLEPIDENEQPIPLEEALFRCQNL